MSDLNELDRLRIAIGSFRNDAAKQWLYENPKVEVLLAAARRFLALTETGRQIQWCEEHYCSVDRWPGEACVWAEAHEKVHSCRVVTKLLIPADYLTEEGP